jgi:hypothetical protein
MTEHVIINKQFMGPPGYGQGGYTGGVVAGLIGSVAEVTLRRPVPCDTELKVQRTDDGGVALSVGDIVVAQGVPTALDIDMPAPMSYEEAVAASKFFPGWKQHPVPTCFVCSPQVPETIGLRIFPGPIRDRSIVATPWTPAAWLGDAEGLVQSQFLWAVLDCAAGWALVALSDFVGPPPYRPAVMGRLAAKINKPIKVGARCVAIGWPIGLDDRKGYAGAAIFSSDGSLHGVGKITYITV